MSAWDKLLAASSLLAGTAWQLISSPKTGSGSGATVYVQQIDVRLDDGNVSSSVVVDVDSVELQDDTITSLVTTVDSESVVADDLIRGTA